MAALFGIISVSGNTPGSGAFSFGRVTAPAEQKVWVWVKVVLQDTAASPAFHPLELRRGVTGGTLNSATPINKVNGQDTETIRTAFATWSVQPSHGTGTKLYNKRILGNRDFAFQRVLLNEGETLDIITASSPGAVPYDIEISIEE
jgi:hypothetical protein